MEKIRKPVSILTLVIAAAFAVQFFNVREMSMPTMLWPAVLIPGSVLFALYAGFFGFDLDPRESFVASIVATVMSVVVAITGDYPQLILALTTASLAVACYKSMSSDQKRSIL